jgi:hypothetical protein
MLPREAALENYMFLLVVGFAARTKPSSPCAAENRSAIIRSFRLTAADEFCIAGNAPVLPQHRTTMDVAWTFT